MTPEQINALSVEIHEQNVERGWWDDPKRCIYQAIQLINTELAEATEADRKSLKDSHLPHRAGEEVELADAAIRLLDLAGWGGWKYAPEPEYVPEQLYLISRYAFALAEQGAAQSHLAMSYMAGVLAYGYFESEPGVFKDFAYPRLLDLIIWRCDQAGYDLFGAITEKLEYNKTRHDHNRSARKSTHGKRY